MRNQKYPHTKRRGKIKPRLLKGVIKNTRVLGGVIKKYPHIKRRAKIKTGLLGGVVKIKSAY